VPATIGAFGGRLRRLLGPDPAAARQSLAALTIGLAASLVAGLALGGITGTLERLPGLLVLVPAAIGLRGTIFGALGGRLGTAIHTGTFRRTLSRDSVLGQNLLATAILTVFTSVVLAVLARIISQVFGLGDVMSVWEFVAISIIGGVISSVPVAAITVVLANRSVERSWDLDNVMAPLVTASGDMVTLPALWLATFIVVWPGVTVAVALVAALAAVVLPVLAFRRGPELVRSVLRESMLVVVAAGVLSLIAGVTLETQLSSLIAYPALLSLVPPFLAAAGALGGIVSSRLTTKLHLGLVEPATVPEPSARADLWGAMVLALPAFALASVVADLAAWIIDLSSPGPLVMLGVALLGGGLATVFAMGVAYWGAIVSYRMGIDPDNVSIPMVTSSIDLVGAFAFILAVLVVVP
jgi:mgtE-like transporter